MILLFNSLLLIVCVSVLCVSAIFFPIAAATVVVVTIATTILHSEFYLMIFFWLYWVRVVFQIRSGFFFFTFVYAWTEKNHSLLNCVTNHSQVKIHFYWQQINQCTCQNEEKSIKKTVRNIKSMQKFIEMFEIRNIYNIFKSETN